MNDRMVARREFLREDSVSRLRSLSLSLVTISELLFDAKAVEVKEKIDETTWLIEWAVLDEAPDVQADLVELQYALRRWRNELSTIAADGPTRACARERAGIWSKRLLWMSAFLEATA